MKNIALIGCGWLGLPLAEKLIENNYHVVGTTTTENKLPYLVSKGIKAHLLNLDDNSYNLSFLTNCQVLFLNIPPGLRKTPQGSFLNKVEILTSKLRDTSIEKIVFANSTAVYNRDGFFNENTPFIPDSDKGLELLEVEKTLSQTIKSFTVIRFGGLFGPNRNPANFIKSATQLEENTTTNLIHLHDAINLSFHTITQNSPKVINGVHPHHPDKFSFYKKAYAMAGKDFPFNSPVTTTERIIEMNTSIEGFEFREKLLFDYL